MLFGSVWTARPQGNNENFWNFAKVSSLNVFFFICIFLDTKKLINVKVKKLNVLPSKCTFWGQNRLQQLCMPEYTVRCLLYLGHMTLARTPFEIFMIMSFWKKKCSPFQCDTTEIKSSVNNSRVCYEQKIFNYCFDYWCYIPNGHYK